MLQGFFGAPLDPSLPLFPDKAGNVISKAAVVKTLETTIEAMGLPIANDVGCKLYGGHSFRVTGARRLAALGVEIAKIMVMARWSSDAVFRYIRDAPLDRLPAEVAELEDQRNLHDTIRELKKEVETIKDAVEQADSNAKAELTKAIAQLSEKFAPTPEKQVIAKISGRKRKIHFALVGGVDENPLDWRTRCGYCYSGWRFSRHESTEGFPPDALCRNCFPVNEEVVHQIEHDPSCSSSASSDEST